MVMLFRDDFGATWADEKPRAPWSIAVLQQGNETILKGFADDIANPIITARVTVAPVGM